MSSPQASAWTPELHDSMEQLRQVLPAQTIDRWQPTATQVVFSSSITVWMMVHQRLHPNATLATTLMSFLQSMQELSQNKRVKDGTLSNNTSGYSRARTRLELEVTNRAADHVFQSLLPQTPKLLADRRVFVVDGTSVALTSNAALRKVWPSAHNQFGSGPWPIVHLALMHELESGITLRPEVGAMYGENAISETALAVRMLPRLPEKAVLMADRNFGIYGFIYPAIQAGHDVVIRLQEARFRVLQKQAELVEPGVWRLKWTPSPRDRRSHPELPKDAAVQIDLHEFQGYSGQKMWMATTLKIESAELASWYARRGEIETNIRQWKKTLEMDTLRGQSEAMILKELSIASIAYNLVTQVRYIAAQREGIAAKRISFTGVWTLVIHFLLKHTEHTAEQWQNSFERVIRGSLQRKLPNRPLRSYAREAYPKSSNYPRKKTEINSKTAKK